MRRHNGGWRDASDTGQLGSDGAALDARGLRPNQHPDAIAGLQTLPARLHDGNPVAAVQTDHELLAVVVLHR